MANPVMYEHMILASHSAGEMEAKLDGASRKGWEVVSLTRFGHTRHDCDIFTALMRRQKAMP
jgi:hypothetical protein